MQHPSWVAALAFSRFQSKDKALKTSKLQRSIGRRDALLSRLVNNQMV
jgi:hypothetical protein